MRFLLASLLLLAVVVTNRAFGASVVAVTNNEEQVTVRPDPGALKSWRLNETVCVYVKGKEMLCGFVGRIVGDAIVIAVQTRDESVTTGQSVQLGNTGRLPASEDEKIDSDRGVFYRPVPKLLDVAVGLSAGLRYFYPTVTVQIPAFRTFALGVQGLFASFTSGDTAIRATGAFVLLSYYATQLPFRGLLFQAGPGFFAQHLEAGGVRQTSQPFAVQAQVQWRGRAHYSLALDLGVGVGVLWVEEPKLPRLTTRFQGVQPLFHTFLAYSF